MAVAPAVAMSTALLGEKLLEFARIDSPAASLLSMLKVPSGGVSASGLLPGVYTLRYHAVKGCNNFRTHHKSRLCAAQHKAAFPQYMREMDSLQRKNRDLVTELWRACGHVSATAAIHAHRDVLHVLRPIGHGG